MHTPLTYNTHVRVGGEYGVIVSISKTHYGVRFAKGEVNYYRHELVTV